MADITVNVDTGDETDVEVDVASHWRTGRWLKNVIHAQRSAQSGLRDRPIGVMLTPSLARLVVDQQNAVNSPYPWGPDVATVVADTSAPMPDRG